MSETISRRSVLGAGGFALAAQAGPAMQAGKTAGKGPGMRVGSDVDKLRPIRDGGPYKVLDYVAGHNLDGAFFRTIQHVSAKLDPSELKAIKAYADEKHVFLDSGIGWINPYNNQAANEIRELGEGDYKLGIEKMIRAAASIGNHELWGVSGHTKGGKPAFLAFDRWRTDTSWEDQFNAMRRFLMSLAPVLRDYKCRVNLETHGDETSFDLVRMCEAIGPDIIGVMLDTGNLPICGEIPMTAVKRLAPYVHGTHFKDGVYYMQDNILHFQYRPVGQGIIDWPPIVAELAKYSPNLHVCFEAYKAEIHMPIYHPTWRANLPDLKQDDIDEALAMVKFCDEKIKGGQLESVESYRQKNIGNLEILDIGAKHIKSIIQQKGLG